MRRRHAADRRRALMALAGTCTLAACTSPPQSASTRRDATTISPGQAEVDAPLGPVDCEIEVFDVGIVDIETDYLPNVINCENGGANLEALKAQAIAARSVAYYAIETDAGICDSQGCQVYSCAASPGPMAFAAVEQTQGQYLSYNAILTYGFYVAGDNDTQPPSCVGTATTGTETWVTYNEGLTGTAVEQTMLGFVHDPADNGYGQNRGCMSQWGARCLENNLGYDYLDILRFYYGADIELLQASGACLGDGDGDGDVSSFEDGSASEESAEAEATASSEATSDNTQGSSDTQATDEGSGTEGELGTEVSTSAADEGAPATGSSGCACRGDTGPPTGGAWALVLLALAGRRRRGLRDGLA